MKFIVNAYKLSLPAVFNLIKGQVSQNWSSNTHCSTRISIIAGYIHTLLLCFGGPVQTNRSIICTIFKGDSGNGSISSKPLPYSIRGTIMFIWLLHEKHRETWLSAAMFLGGAWHSFCSLDSFKLQSITRGKISRSQLQTKYKNILYSMSCLPILFACVYSPRYVHTNQIMSPLPSNRALLWKKKNGLQLNHCNLLTKTTGVGLY